MEKLSSLQRRFVAGRATMFRTARPPPYAQHMRMEGAHSLDQAGRSLMGTVPGGHGRRKSARCKSPDLGRDQLSRHLWGSSPEGKSQSRNLSGRWRKIGHHSDLSLAPGHDKATISGIIFTLEAQSFHALYFRSPETAAPAGAGIELTVISQATRAVTDHAPRHSTPSFPCRHAWEDRTGPFHSLREPGRRLKTFMAVPCQQSTFRAIFVVQEPLPSDRSLMFQGLKNSLQAPHLSLGLY